MIFSVSNRRIPAWKPLALVSALSTCFLPYAFAQEQNDKTLPQVVVTASRFEQPQTEALPHTTVITAEMIRNRQASDLPTLLRSEAGIEIVQSGGAGSQTSLFMRGTNSNQSLIMIDGVPIRGSSGGVAELEHILPDQIERIEIVRGNVSAIYGSGAIGGVIQVFTKRGSGQPAVSMSAEAGSRGTTKVSGSVSGQSGDTRYALSATRFKTDGFSSNNTSQYPNENPDKDGDRNITLAGSVSQEWSKGNELGARIYAYDAKFNFDGGGDFFSIPTQTDESKSKQQTIAIFSKNRFSPKWLSTATLSHSEARNEALTMQNSAVFSVSNYKSNTSMLQWANEIMLSPNWIMTAGFDAASEKANVYSDHQVYGNSQFSPSRSNSSLFSGLNGKYDAHSLQLNLRNDNVGGSGSDTTYYLGYGYALNPAWKLIASTSTAFHAPTLSQLYDPIYGNLNLKAERARSHEAGMQYAVGPTLVRATVFESKTHDQFGYDALFNLVNINRASNRGLELSASSRIYDLDARASLTLQDPKNDATDETLQRRAKTMASLALSKAIGAWRLGGDVQYIGHRPDASYDASFQKIPQELSSLWLVNLNARYQISKEVSLFGRIENLFDREYQMAYGYNQAPRGVFVGVNWRQ